MTKIVRVGEFKDYTLIENACLRDKALDIAERGLLVTMLSLPDSWDFNGVGLSSILPCGKSKVYSTFNKLEAVGYLKRKRVYENGKVSAGNIIYAADLYLEMKIQRIMRLKITAKIKIQIKIKMWISLWITVWIILKVIQIIYKLLLIISAITALTQKTIPYLQKTYFQKIKR